MQEAYRILLKQHIGAPSEPVVEVGDTVKRGQLIAKCPEASLGANLHTSVSGTVLDVTDRYINIKADAKQSEDYVKLTGTVPLELVKEAGIVGLGGAGFPTHVKLGKPFEKDGIIIVNAAECEPILAHNMASIEREPANLIEGLKIVLSITNAKKGIIAIKEKHKEALDALKNALNATAKGIDITISLLPDLYPMGEERAIIREVLGPVLEVDQLPLAAGAIVINVETVERIREAVELKKPLIDKDMTVAGKLNGDLIKVFTNVPIGTTVGEMLERAGGISVAEYGELVMGGPFTGKRTDADDPVVKTTGGILVAETFFKGQKKLGLLVCACGGNKERLEQIAASMGSEVAGVEYCKQAKEVKGALKCENPGRCPGQVQKVMALRKAGAQAVLISNCSDCSNTVMSCAPNLKLPVYHCTDGPLRAVNFKLIRRLKLVDI